MAALAEQGAACKEALRIKQQILLNVTTAFYNLIANTELEKVANKNLERATNNHKVTQDRQGVGAVSLSDVFRAQVVVAQAKQEIVKVHSLVRIAKVNLNAAMGLPPDITIEISPGAEETTPPQNIDLKAAQNTAIRQRPELQVLEKHLCALAYRIQQAHSAYGPKLSAEGSYGRRDSDWFPTDPEWLVGVSLDVPLYTGYAYTHNLRKAKAEFCKAKAEYDSAIIGVQQEVWTAYSRLLEAYETIETSIAQARDANESMRLTEERYKAGAGIVSDLLDSQTSLARAEATHVDALWSYQSARTVFLWTQGLLFLDCD